MLCAYIMAGGSGERFWPLSTPERPKQLLKLFSEKSMIRETVDRILPLIPAENIFIGTNVKQAKGILEELPMIPEENVVIEPSFKDTAAAIGYGALYIRNRIKDACMIVLASDHLIQDSKTFREMVILASQEAISQHTMVTLGIKPAYAETGYGYIEVMNEVELAKIYRVERFWEKPNKERAQAYVESGKFLWNSGMFIFEADTILEEIERYMPKHYTTLQAIEELIKQGLNKEALALEVAAYFENFEKISIDFGVMERSVRIRVIPSEFGWNDIGSFSALGEIFPSDESGNVVRNSKVRTLDAQDNVVITENNEVGLIGVTDLVVVQTEGKLLICHKDRTQDIKKILG